MVVILKCIDNGVGFSTEKKDLIFDRFTIARSKGTIGKRSTGLGIYLSKKIIDKHLGTIKATSLGEGKGVEFTVCLPD